MNQDKALEPYHFHRKEWEDYDDLREWFQWRVPNSFNIAEYACERWSKGSDRIALYDTSKGTDGVAYTFQELSSLSSRLASYLRDRGIRRGDRVAVSGVQKVETLLGYLAAWKLGAITVPISVLYGTKGLQFRLTDSGTKAYIVDGDGAKALRPLLGNVSPLEVVVPYDEDVSLATGPDLWSALKDYDNEIEIADTAAGDEAAIFYTSGTTGDPKGVVLPHKCLLGVLPTYLTTHTNMKTDGVFWMPSEWSWILFLGKVISGHFYGKPTVAHHTRKFNPEEAFHIIDEYDVTEMSVPPTAIRMMMEVENPARRYSLDSLRLIQSAAEPVDEYLRKWAETVFNDVIFHTGYGQTEAPVFIGDCEALGRPHHRDKLGVPGPGHNVSILDPENYDVRAPSGEVGEIALRNDGDPLIFSEYWDAPEKTAEKFHGEWLLTEDLGVVDDDGYFAFVSRRDRIILCSGYKIGPGEIEEALNTHPDVVESAVIGIPDERKGEVPKAFVKLQSGVEPSGRLMELLKNHTRKRLSEYQYPREIEFVSSLPKTVTGKIQHHELAEPNDTWEHDE